MLTLDWSASEAEQLKLPYHSGSSTIFVRQLYEILELWL
jgi:hypothetical protein